MLTTIAIALTLAVSPPTFAERHGCDETLPSAKAYQVIRHELFNTNPYVRKQRVHRWTTCLATRAKAHEAHRRARVYWAWRHSYPVVFAIKFNRFPSWIHDRLASISDCESGGSPTAIGGGGAFRGKYQFTFGTWKTVGGSGDPAKAAESEQDYRAGVLLTTSGTGPWPVCGQ